MESSIWVMALKILIFLPFTILLIYVVLRYGNNKAYMMQKGKYIKIIERVNLTKDSSIIILNAGEKYLLMSCTGSHNEILMELSPEEINDYLHSKDTSMKDGLNKLNKLINRGRS